MYIIRYDDFYNRVTELCEERGWSSYRLIKESNIPSSTFYNMFERKSIPQLDLVQKICDGLNISLGQFFSDNVENNNDLSKDDMLFVITSRGLSSKNRNRALAYMKGLRDMENDE